MSMNPLKRIGNELIATGESIRFISLTIEVTCKALLEMSEAMGILVAALHETDLLLQNAGREINAVKIPKVDFDYANVAGMSVISKISLDSQSAFGPTGNDLLKSGQLLHQSELQLIILKDKIHDLSKPKGPLDVLVTNILNPLADRLKKLGDTIN